MEKYPTYFGGVAGLLALIASALTFIYVNVNNIVHQYVMSDKINILSLMYPGFQGVDPNGDMLVSNFGDGDLFLLDLVIEFKTGNITSNHGIPIGYDIKT